MLLNSYLTELDNLNISEMFLGHWHVRAFDTYFSCCSFLLSLNVFHSSFFKIRIERISYRSPVITLAAGFEGSEACQEGQDLILAEPHNLLSVCTMLDY